MKSIYDKLIETYGEEAMLDLHKKASKAHPEIKEVSKFVNWVEEYILDSFTELLEEYEIDHE